MKCLIGVYKGSRSVQITKILNNDESLNIQEKNKSDNTDEVVMEA
jgi:hypothetical protein